MNYVAPKHGICRLLGAGQSAAYSEIFLPHIGRLQGLQNAFRGLIEACHEFRLVHDVFAKEQLAKADGVFSRTMMERCRISFSDLLHTSANNVGRQRRQSRHLCRRRVCRPESGGRGWCGSGWRF